MNQRLRQIIDRLKNELKVYTDADFARLAEVSRSELSQMLTGKRPVSKRIVNTLLTEFPEISEEWLRTGEGDMLNLAYSHDVSPTVLADDHSTAIAGNKNVVNADQTIAMLVAEVSAQRRLREKGLEQTSELLAIVAGRK